MDRPSAAGSGEAHKQVAGFGAGKLGVVKQQKRSNRLASKHAVTSVTLLGTTVTDRPFTHIVTHFLQEVNIEKTSK